MIQLNLFINKNIVNFILLLYKLMRCFMRKRLLIVFSVLLFLLCLSVVSATDENTNSSIVAQDYDGNVVTKDLNMKYLDGSNFTAQVLDGKGTPLANQTVSFNVNGVFYHRITNEDGIASLRIRLMSGEYIITSYWNNFQTGNTIKIY